MRPLWAGLALAALAGLVAVRRRPALPRRRVWLTLLALVAVVAAIVALQGVVMATGSALLLGVAVLLAARGGLREPGGRFTGRGVSVLVLLVTGGLLLAFAVGAALEPDRARPSRGSAPAAAPATPAAPAAPNPAAPAAPNPAAPVAPAPNPAQEAP